MNIVISTLVVALGCSAGAALAQQNLIVNGSFENGGQTGVQHFPGWNLVGPADNNSKYGVAESGVSPAVAEQGSFYAYFHGNPTDSSQDCLGQSLSLTVGAQYTISYCLATDGTTLGSGAAMWVVIGTSFGIDYSQDVLLTAYYPNSAGALPYQQFTTTVTATNDSEILSFHGIDATSDILLDNVSMTLTVPSAPKLSVQRSATNTLVFAWPSSAAGYRLQTNASLVATNWGTFTNAPAIVGSNNQITLPAPHRNLFFRLTLPK